MQCNAKQPVWHLREVRHPSGFTIVELLIVIVVIAVLAAITIIAFNGVQDRARAAAVTAALNQASKKLELYSVDNGGYPAALSDAGVSNGTNVTYQYTAGTAPSATYCTTATQGTTSYWISSTSKTPTQGGCPGHGQGGVAAITNLAVNPSFESGLGACGASWGTGGAGTWASGTSGAQSGGSYSRMTFSQAPTGYAGVWSYCDSPVTAVPNAKTYTATGYVRTSWSSKFFPDIVAFSATGTYLGEAYGPKISTPAGAWTRLSVTYSVPAQTSKLTLRFYQDSGGTLPSVGATLDTDSIMLTEGAQAYTFSDGNSPNWVWNGSPNASTSTGPPL